jgi:hypothetical protein
MRYGYKIFVEKNLKGKDLLDDLDVDGNIILEWVLGKWSGKLWIGFMWFRIGTKDN